MIVFSKQWFKKYNKAITFVARLPFIGELTFNFKKFGHYIDRKKIVEVTPNSVIEFIGYKKGKAELKQHFFVRNEYALRLQKVFYPIWITFHIWDIITRPFPQLNLGFDTLTVYPNYDGESGATTLDGYVRYFTTATSWSTIRNSSSGDEAGTSGTQGQVTITGQQNSWIMLRREFLLFNTSSLTSSSTISSSILSLYGVTKNDQKSINPNIDIYTSTPASNTSLEIGDYDQIGTTSQTGSPISYSSWSTSGYNDFTLNSTGLGNISKTGISKFGARNANYDVANIEPTTGAGSGINNLVWYSSDNGSDKPKLVVTYTLPVTFIPRTMWFN